MTVAKVRASRAARVLLTTAFKTAPGRASAVVFLTTFGGISGALIGYWMKLLVDAAVGRDLARAIFVAGGITATTGISMLASITGFLLRIGLEERTGLAIDEALIDAAAGIEGIEHHERPEYVDQIELLRNERANLSSSIGAIVENIAMFARVGTTVGLLSSIHPVMLLLPLFGLPSIGAAAKSQSILLRAEERLSELRRKCKHLFDLATTAAPGKELRVFGLGAHLISRHAELYNEVDRLARRARVKAALVSSAGWAIFALGYGGALGFVVMRGIHGRFAGAITAGSVVLAFQLAAQVNTQVSGLVNVTAWMLRNMRTAGRYVWLLEYAHNRAASPAGPASLPARIAHGIDLEGVSFRYPGTERDVLRDVSLHIPAGATVAVVGDNGAGKSTLMKLLCRFYAPTGGAVILDGVDIGRFDIDEWRARLSAGFQDFARFEFLARETIGVGLLEQIDDEGAVRAALGRASATDVVDALSRGLDTQLGKSFDDGVELSGGQWQKLALGRAMMRPSPLVLVLDEPTAALDAQTEHALFERYAVAARDAARETGAITIFVSHRFSTVRMADMIVVINDGRVAESGSHEALVARGGLYAELYELQARAYR